MRVALEVLDEGAPDLGLGPALGRVGDALSEAHRLGLGLKLGRHRLQFRLQFRASGAGRAAVVETAPRLAFGRSELRSLAARLRRLASLAGLASSKHTSKRHQELSSRRTPFDASLDHYKQEFPSMLVRGAKQV